MAKIIRKRKYVRRTKKAKRTTRKKYRRYIKSKFKRRYKKKYAKRMKNFNSRDKAQHKFSIWCSPAEFACISNPQLLQELISLATISSGTNGDPIAMQGFSAYDEDIPNTCTDWLMHYFHLMKYQELNSVFPRDFSKEDYSYRQLISFNPFISPQLFGKEVVDYFKKYRQFKYVGCKVKWKPAKRVVSSSFVPTDAVINGMSSLKNSVTVKPSTDSSLVTGYAPIQGLSPGTFVDYTVSPPAPAAQFRTTVLNPSYKGDVSYPNYTLRVKEYSSSNYYFHVFFDRRIIFQEQGLSVLNFQEESMSTKPTTYKMTLGSLLTDVTPYFLTVPYNTPDGRPILEGSPYYKTFNLAKPFKFYCRPQLEKSPIFESSTTPTKVEVSSNVTESFKGKQTRFPYIDIMNQIWPTLLDLPSKQEAAALVQNPDSSYNHYSLKRLNQLQNGANYLNPLLFYYGFSTDAELSSSGNTFGTLFTQPNLQGTKRTLSSIVKDIDTMHSLGRFKVTFYSRFKTQRTVSELSKVNLNIPQQQLITKEGQAELQE